MRAQQLLRAKDDDALFQFYKKSAMELAFQFIDNPESLSSDEINRLLSESTWKEKAFLSQRLPNTSPLLRQLDELFQLPTRQIFSILL